MLKQSENKNNTTLNNPHADRTDRNIVDKVCFSFSSSCLCSATYFITPFSNPKVANASVVVRKFRKFPTKAIPLGPTKTAITLEVIKPIATLSKILIPFKEVALNRGLDSISLMNFN